MLPVSFALIALASAQDADDASPSVRSPAAAPDAGARRVGTSPDEIIRPWGMLQVFTTLMDQDTDVQADPASYGDPEADPGFDVARARFGFTGELPRRNPDAPVVDYGLSMGIATPFDALQLADTGVSIVDAYGRVTAKPGIGRSWLMLGLVKVPFSREAQMSSMDLVFMERAVVTENVTNVRDVGLMGRQEFDLGSADDSPHIALSGGVFNGNNSFLGDTDPGLMYAGRLELEKGDTTMSWNPAGGTAYGVGVSGLLNDELATRTASVAVDGFVRLGGWSLLAELGHSTLTPTRTDLGIPDVFTETRRLGWTASTTYWVPLNKDRDPDAPGLEFSVRASSFDDNRAVSDNGDVLIVHGGVLARSILPMTDLGAGYIHRSELGGRNLPNDTIRLWTQFRPQGRYRPQVR